jgi:hypothetical protein
MGVAIPGGGFVEDRASGALVVDGSLRFDSSKSHYLSRTPGSAGNSNRFTFGGWLKLSKIPGALTSIIGGGASGIEFVIGFNSSAQFFMQEISGGGATTYYNVTTTAVFRDPSSWYHLTVALDTTEATGSNRIKLWINGSTVQLNFNTTPSLNYSTLFADATYKRGIGAISANHTDYAYLDAYLSTTYFIDGQALDASYFGYTDALTNTWRPKKLSSSVAFGTNGFYLPFDGSAPIGQDQSGRGNNWTPVNFGGSNTLEKATGALPILNTDGGGKVARVGVRTDSSASSLVLALPLVGIKSDFSNAVNSGTSNKAITANGGISGSSVQSNFYGGSYLFDGSNDYLSSSSADYGFSSGTAFTIEGWFYASSLPTSADGSGGGIFGSRGYVESNSFTVYIGSSSSNTIGVHVGGGTATFFNAPGGLKTSTWNHIAMVRNTSNTVEFFVNGISIGTGSPAGDLSNGAMYIGCWGTGNGAFFSGYIQDFRIYKGLAKYTSNFIPASTDPDILPDTPSGVSYTSNLTQITDGAVAFDGSGDYLSLASSADFNIGSNAASLELFVYLNSTSSAQIFNGQNSGSNSTIRLGYWVDVGNIGFSYTVNDDTRRGKVLGAVGKWYHLLVTITGGTGRFFIDGVLQSYDTGLGSVQSLNETYYIGTEGASEGPLNGFISNFHLVNGSIPTQYQTSVTTIGTQVFTPPTGPISSVANTKLLCCKSNSSATAFDVSPGTITANGNAVATNFNPFTVNINTQRGKQSGYCTLNPLDNGGLTLVEGNLGFSLVSAGNWRTARGTFFFPSGKWYWEVTANTYVSGGVPWGFGVADATASLTTDIGSNAGGWVYESNGNKKNNNSSVSYGSSWSTGAIIGVALDLDNGTLVFYRNGVSQGTAYTGLAGKSLSPIVGLYPGETSGTAYVNFGQKPFKFPPPAGFQPLALANTPRPTIVRPDQFMGVTTYTGTGAARSINTGFKPDFVWLKSRSSGSYSHNLYDAVRGATKILYSDSTSSENTDANGLTAFNSDGFSLGSTAATNESSTTYVAWAWKAGGNSNTFNINDVGYATASAAGLTAGTITPTGASVNTKSGFSIVKWNGSGSSGTLSHGLGNTPGLILLKGTSSGEGSNNWRTYHSALGTSPSNTLFLNLTNASSSNTERISAVGTNTFTLSSGGSGVNESGQSYISYLWAEVPGFSKFGSYTGNGSTDGPMVITGFRPRWIMYKAATGTTYNWGIYDTERDKFNGAVQNLAPNASDIDTNYGVYMDILSNGFKVRAVGNLNESGSTYIYAAFAETPTQNLYGAQSNAR